MAADNPELTARRAALPMSQASTVEHDRLGEERECTVLEKGRPGPQPHRDEQTKARTHVELAAERKEAAAETGS